MGHTARDDRDDPTVYPEEERVGEELLQRWIIEVLRPLLERWLNGPGGRAPSLVGADQFVYYQRHEPTRRFAPDLYVLPGVEPQTRIRSWKTWQDGPAPPFVLEIASSNWRKDYEEIPSICGEAGVQELVIFDPSFAERPGGDGARFQIYRRDASEGWGLVESHDRDRARSDYLGLWFRMVGFGDRTRLRLATDPDGEAFLATLEEEKAQALTELERAREGAEAEKARAEAERARAEAQRARAEAAEAELARLRRALGEGTGD